MIDQFDNFHIDVLRELGSIGMGNAATALSGVLDKKIEMNVPQVRILENNEAIRMLGGPERVVAGVLVRFTGEIEGVVLYLQSVESVDSLLSDLIPNTEHKTGALDELATSALLEVGNIMIASYVNSAIELTGLKIKLSVPAISINMLGAILSVPMAEYENEADKLIIVDGDIFFDGLPVKNHLLMVPTMESLNTILEKLGVARE